VQNLAIDITHRVCVCQCCLNLDLVCSHPPRVKVIDERRDGYDGHGKETQSPAAEEHVGDDPTDAHHRFDRESEHPGQVIGHLGSVGCQPRRDFSGL
jgi:hypothetical protein